MSDNTTEDYRWTVRGVEPELVRQLRILALRRDVNVAELANQALREFLDRAGVKVVAR